MKKLDRTNKIRLIALIIFVAFSIGITILFIPLINNMRSEEGRILIKQKVEYFGVFAPLMFMCLHILHIVIAFIPGEPVEILGGLLFGTFWGFLFSMIGTLAGSTAVYFLVKSLGKPLVHAFIPEGKMKKFKILNDQRKLEVLVFILFLIPGTPKDTLTYLVPLTKIKPVKYFILSMIGRIPSILSSSFVGASLGKGNIQISVIIFIITGAIGIVGILFNDRVNKKS